jgi:hypothetical protein
VVLGVELVAPIEPDEPEPVEPEVPDEPESVALLGLPPPGVLRLPLAPMLDEEPVPEPEVDGVLPAEPPIDVLLLLELPGVAVPPVLPLPIEPEPDEPVVPEPAVLVVLLPGVAPAPAVPLSLRPQAASDRAPAMATARAAPRVNWEAIILWNSWLRFGLSWEEKGSLGSLGDAVGCLTPFWGPPPARLSSRTVEGCRTSAERQQTAGLAADELRFVGASANGPCHGGFDPPSITGGRQWRGRTPGDGSRRPPG